MGKSEVLIKKDDESKRKKGEAVIKIMIVIT